MCCEREVLEMLVGRGFHGKTMLSNMHVCDKNVHIGMGCAVRKFTSFNRRLVMRLVRAVHLEETTNRGISCKVSVSNPVITPTTTTTCSFSKANFPNVKEDPSRIILPSAGAINKCHAYCRCAARVICSDVRRV